MATEEIIKSFGYVFLDLQFYILDHITLYCQLIIIYEVINLIVENKKSIGVISSNLNLHYQVYSLLEK